MFEEGTLTGLGDGKTGKIVTERGDTVNLAICDRQAAGKSDGGISFTKRPRHTFEFPQNGQPAAFKRSPCGRRAEFWGTLGPANGDGAFNGHHNGNGTQHPDGME